MLHKRIRDKEQGQMKIVKTSVADPDPDPVGSGLFGHPDPDPGKYRIRILYPQKTPVILIFSIYKIV